MQAITLKECDVYSYKGDGDMDPLSKALDWTMLSCGLSPQYSLFKRACWVLQARKALSGASTTSSTTGS